MLIINFILDIFLYRKIEKDFYSPNIFILFVIFCRYSKLDKIFHNFFLLFRLECYYLDRLLTVISLNLLYKNHGLLSMVFSSQIFNNIFNFLYYQQDREIYMGFLIIQKEILLCQYQMILLYHFIEMCCIFSQYFIYIYLIIFFSFLLEIFV